MFVICVSGDTRAARDPSMSIEHDGHSRLRFTGRVPEPAVRLGRGVRTIRAPPITLHLLL